MCILYSCSFLMFQQHLSIVFSDMALIFKGFKSTTHNLLLCFGTNFIYIFRNQSNTCYTFTIFVIRYKFSKLT